jgi:hypothetical protein
LFLDAHGESRARETYDAQWRVTQPIDIAIVRERHYIGEASKYSMD